MRVKLVYSSIDQLPPERLERLQNVERLKFIRYNAGNIPLGTELTVYGIAVSDGNVLYDVEHYPGGQVLIVCLAELFDVVDPRASETWECRIPDAGGIRIWPASWFTYEFYHDRLSDGEPELQADFKRLKALFADEAQRGASSAEPIK